MTENNICSSWSGQDIPAEETVYRETAWGRKEEHDSGSFVGKETHGHQQEGPLYDSPPSSVIS